MLTDISHRIPMLISLAEGRIVVIRRDILICLLKWLLSIVSGMCWRPTLVRVNLNAMECSILQYTVLMTESESE